MQCLGHARARLDRYDLIDPPRERDAESPGAGTNIEDAIRARQMRHDQVDHTIMAPRRAAEAVDPWRIPIRRCRPVRVAQALELRSRGLERRAPLSPRARLGRGRPPGTYRRCDDVTGSAPQHGERWWIQ